MYIQRSLGYIYAFYFAIARFFLFISYSAKPTHTIMAYCEVSTYNHTPASLSNIVQKVWVRSRNFSFDAACVCVCLHVCVCWEILIQIFLISFFGFRACFVSLYRADIHVCHFTFARNIFIKCTQTCKLVRVLHLIYFFLFCWASQSECARTMSAWCLVLRVHYYQ